MCRGWCRSFDKAALMHLLLSDVGSNHQLEDPGKARKLMPSLCEALQYPKWQALEMLQHDPHSYWDSPALVITLLTVSL